jgi:ketosteroid isomerase-like protein
MKKLVAGIVAVAIGAALFAAAANAVAAKSSDQAQIEALEDRFAKAVEARDVDAIMACYETGPSIVVFDVIPPRQYVGADAYRKDWQGFLGGFNGPVTVQVSGLSVISDGKLAISHSIQRITGTGKDGKPVDLTLRVTDGYRKVGGRWLIIHEHVSVPVNLDTDKGDLTSAP